MISDTFSDRELDTLRRKLLAWYDRHQRQLPWRESRDPYRIWLSEIMLQQTTVAAVIPYFERFLARFPNLQILARADEADVLQLWEGLGYYSRARNIHRTAQLLVRQGGKFPSDPAELVKLPGIGRYTAGAIASFAFQQPAPIVEANTQRLYARLLAWDQPLTTAVSQKILWNLAARLVSPTRPGACNQALMDLGSQVCTPAAPRCEACPVQVHCRAYLQGCQHRLPLARQRVPPTPVTHLCIALRSGSRFLLHRYQPGERWAGLWDFPRWENNDIPCDLFPTRKKNRPILLPDAALHAPWLSAIEDDFSRRFQARITLQRHLVTFRHAVTRFAITLICFEATTSARSLKQGVSQQKWTSPADFPDHAFSTTGRRLANLLTRSHPE